MQILLLQCLNEFIGEGTTRLVCPEALIELTQGGSNNCAWMVGPHFVQPHLPRGYLPWHSLQTFPRARAKAPPKPLHAVALLKLPPKHLQRVLPKPPRNLLPKAPSATLPNRNQKALPNLLRND